jgi:hypothetical protein
MYVHTAREIGKGNGTDTIREMKLLAGFAATVI